MRWFDAAVSVVYIDDLALCVVVCSGVVCCLKSSFVAASPVIIDR
jgi:hypothetical protein